MIRKSIVCALAMAVGWASSALAQDIDPRARVAQDMANRVPDHIGQPAGPPATTHAYDGVLEPHKIYEIAANPEAGFHWPYYLQLPRTIRPDAPFLIEPNNDGRWGAPFETHAYWAGIRNEQLLFDFGRYLDVPMITPIFPRPLVNGSDGNLYIHALTRATLTHDDPAYARPDLQLLAMMDDARTKLIEAGHTPSDEALLWGFSAAADFVTRMTILHPDRVRAVVAGGIGGLPILPLEQIDGTTLTYPVGISDMEALTGQPFHTEAFRHTSYLLFQGGADENDSVPEPPFTCDDYGSDSYDCAQAQWINDRFGASAVGRVPQIREVFTAFGMADFNSLILPGINHWTPKSMEVEIRAYFACVVENGEACARNASTPDLTEALAEQNARPPRP